MANITIWLPSNDDYNEGPTTQEFTYLPAAISNSSINLWNGIDYMDIEFGKIYLSRTIANSTNVEYQAYNMTQNVFDNISSIMSQNTSNSITINLKSTSGELEMRFLVMYFQNQNQNQQQRPWKLQ